MIRVLTILAAVFALAVTAAPASAGLLSSPLGVSASPNCYFVPIPYPAMGGVHDNVSDQTYLKVEMEHTLISS